MAVTSHPFTDPISHETVVLHVDDDPGVSHPRCDQRARVSPELDCFYCTACRWNGRISGAWYIDMIDAVS